MRLFIVASALFFTACSSGPAKKANETPPSSGTVKTATTDAKAAVAKSTVKNKKSADVQTATEGSTTTTCIYNKVKREIKINQTVDKCTVEYVKDGSSQEVATGAANSSFCTEIADRVKNNLTTAGYQCQ